LPIVGLTPSYVLAMAGHLRKYSRSDITTGAAHPDMSQWRKISTETP